MTSIDQPPALAGGVHRGDRDQWYRLAAKALARDLSTGDDPVAVVEGLRSRTYDGIVIEPLYTDPLDSAGLGGAGAAAPSDIGYPGSSPFIRGRTTTGARAGGWDVRQVVDAAVNPSTAVDELERGATSLWVCVRHLRTVDDVRLAAALDGVQLDLTSVTLDAGFRWPVAAEALMSVWDASGVESVRTAGSFGADPIGAYASSGGTTDLDRELIMLSMLAGRVADSHPHVGVVVVDATRFHEAGGSDAQELGIALAVGVAYLRAYEAAGLDVTVAFRQIELRLSATADQFATIAKIRAARRLWARVAEVAGDDDVAGRTRIHAVTSSAMMTRYDPWVNVLRGTVASFAAGVAGADAITVMPYDAAITATGSELGRRIARNTQSILAKEAHLARVLDPAGGSYFVERLTDQLAQRAWVFFQQIEREGGVRAAVDSGSVATDLDRSWQARRRDIVTRTTPITGVSEFADVAEPPPLPLPLPPDHSAGGDPRDSDPDPAFDPAGRVSPFALPRHRYSEPFEVLRARVDQAAASARGRPRLLLANLGAPAAHAARTAFARNVFEVAGIVAVSGAGTLEPLAIIAQLAASGADVVCVCGSNSTYADIGVDVVRALRRAGVAHVYVAGRPPGLTDAFADAGVDVFLAAGDDIEQLLADLLRRLGVQ